MAQMESVNAHRKNYAALPKVDAVSIQYCGNKGSFKEGKYTACSFIVMVNVKGVWKPEGVWMHDAGMKTENRRGVYTTIEKAKEAKERILTRWGKEEREEGKPQEGKQRGASAAAKSALAAKDAEIEALKAEIAAIKAALAK